MGWSVAGTYWLLESSIHTWVFHESTFWQNVFFPQPNELWMRSLTVGLFVSFSHVAQWMQTREDGSRMRLKMLSQALEHAADGVIVTDADGVIEWVNPAFSRITGYSSAEAMGHSPAVLGLGANNPDAQALHAQLKKGEIWAGAILDRRKDGSYYPAQLSLAPVQDSEGVTRHIICIQRDTSAVVDFDSQLRQAKRYQEMGAVAGHVAHDFKNLLGVIQGAAELGRLNTTNDDVRKRFQTIERTTSHASAVVRQLMQIAAAPPEDASPIDVDAWLDDTWEGVQAIVAPDLDLELERPMPNLRIRGDEGQLQQVLFNLVQNAADAVSPKGGHIGVRVYARRPEFGDPANSHGMLVLQVDDNGPGIPAHKISKIFQPYFTTKGKSGGTGLGLSTVYNIVKRHGGEVTVESEAGHGCVFRVELPLEPPRSGLSLPRLAGYRGLILAEDDELLGEHLQALESVGVRGTPAFGTTEAIRLAHRDQADLRFVFVGVPMAPAEAERFTRDVQAAAPGIAVIFTVQAVDGRSIPGATLIKEPFGADELLTAIQHPGAPKGSVYA